MAKEVRTKENRLREILAKSLVIAVIKAHPHYMIIMKQPAQILSHRSIHIST